jgi:hypothetical protein
MDVTHGDVSKVGQVCGIQRDIVRFADLEAISPESPDQEMGNNDGRQLGV